MSTPLESLPPAFGLVDFDAEHGLFKNDPAPDGICRLMLVSRTERGYPRRELATVTCAVWAEVSPTVQRELLRSMEPPEQGPKPPAFKSGDNALSPLIARELAVLLWSLMEDTEGTHLDALVAGWRQLAREERWWLYARASNPSQRQGQGWRRALFFALTDPADTHTAPRLLDIVEAAAAQKKKPSSTQPISNPNASQEKQTRRSRPRKKDSKPPIPDSRPLALRKSKPQAPKPADNSPTKAKRRPKPSN